MFFLDGILFAIVLPWYKEKIRGPHLPFELLEKELERKPGWPPVGTYKNNDTKIGKYKTETKSFVRQFFQTIQ